MDNTSLQYQKYLAYLRSKEWIAVKDAIFLDRGFSCENCGKPSESKKGLEVHHLTYERLYNEKPEDLQILCKRCHLLVHRMIKGDIKFTIPAPAFIKSFAASWLHIHRNATPNEFFAIHAMSMILKFNTNQVEYLNDKTRIEEFMVLWQVSKNMVSKIKARVKELGVIAQVGKYWYFNPFLSLYGTVTDAKVADAFATTELRKIFLTQTAKYD